jgi:translation initiation factor 5B
MLSMIRQPIVTVLGHVDHGKTTLLDFIRNSRVQIKEAGGITQHIGATEIPADFIKEQCSYFLKKLGIDVTIPGLLFIDTPGHEAFMNLRKRGGSLADLAVLVIDINQGVQPQTIESLEIMKHFKVPFIIAANKIDRIRNWDSTKHACFTNSWELQTEDAKMQLENKLYEIMGKLAQLGFDSDRFDRVSDFTKQVSIIPVCAKTGEGVMDLLAVIAGLAQRFLQTQLKTTDGPAMATILEIKEEKGLGKVFDSIVYEGTLKVGDTVVTGCPEGTVTGKVRLLLKPKPMDEMRDPTDRFDRVKEVRAASGVRIVAQGCENAVAGSLIMSDQVVDASKKIMEDLEHVKIETEGAGIVLKADALGSLEAIAGLVKDKGIPIRLADIGDVSRKDVVETENASNIDPFTAAIIAFHVKLLPDAEKIAKDKKIKIIQGKIIYKLLEEYEEWVTIRKEEEKKKQLDKLIRGAKFKLIPGYVFRQSKPAVVGVEIQNGILKPGTDVMNEEGKVVGSVKQIQDQGETIHTASKGMSVAVSIDGPTVGRQINEKDILFSVMTEPNYRKLVEFKELLEPGEAEVLEEIKNIMRRTQRKTWGMT